jgi:nucleoside-triphosphatase THEP1
MSLKISVRDNAKAFMEINLPAPDQHGAIILVTGDRRSGKTTLLLRLRLAAQAHGLSTGGILSVARFAGAEKVGIDIMDAATGTVRPLAVVGTGGPIHTGHYRFEPSGIAAGLHFANMGYNADVFFVDELGPLELQRGEGWAQVLPLIAARAYGVAFVVVRPELITLARARLNLADATPTLFVDPSTREALADQLIAWLSQRQPG